jgi:hypothetical protein
VPVSEKPPAAMPARPALEAAILQHARARGPEKSICPSEVARQFGDDWQRYTTAVRQAAFVLARDGKIEVLRKGKPVQNLDEVRGVIRLRVVRTDE